MQDSLKKLIPDNLFLRLKYRQVMGKPLHLHNPKTLNEKLQWLKLHDRNPKYIDLVDKYEVKKYVADKIGENYIIPTYGVWDCFDEIDFDSLPNQFVLKCTHDNGGIVICSDKKNLDMNAARETLNNHLNRNYYWYGREWPYKNVKPRIIAEKYMVDNEDGSIPDYKFYCFNGQADVVLVCIGRNTGLTKFYFFDQEWRLKRYNRWGKAAPLNFTLPKPSNMDQMFEIVNILSQGIPFVRMDLYNVKGKIYFGEYTLYPSSGWDTERLYKADLYFGSKLNIDVIKTRNHK